MKDEPDEKVFNRKIKDAHDIERCLEQVITDNEKIKNPKKEIEDCMLKNA